MNEDKQDKINNRARKAWERHYKAQKLFMRLCVVNGMDEDDARKLFYDLGA